VVHHRWIHPGPLCDSAHRRPVETPLGELHPGGIEQRRAGIRPAGTATPTAALRSRPTHPVRRRSVVAPSPSARMAIPATTARLVQTAVGTVAAPVSSVIPAAA
jgi:hypothetical protein